MTGWIRNFLKRFGIKRLANENSDASQESKYIKTEYVTEYVEVEVLNETVAGGRPIILPKTSTVSPKVEASTEDIISDADANQCLGQIIKWATQRRMDALYLTMLQNLKTRAIKGRRKRRNR